MKITKITFQFNSKSSGQNVPEALSIAEKCDGTIENNFYKVNFSSPEDENLEKLYKLVGNLKGSQISIDDGERINAVKFFNAVNCKDRLLCKGICNHFRLSYYLSDQFLEKYADQIENGVFSTSNERIVRTLSDFLDPIEENRFKINKESFLIRFQSETEMENILCPKYKLEKIKSEIDKLPDEIILIPEEIKEEEVNIDNFVKNILINCEIDSNLSFDDILNCSKAISILLLKSRGIPIQNTDIWIYSFPLFSDQHILLKLIIPEDIPELSEDLEIENVVVKENDLYCVKTSLYRMYFQIFKADDLGKAESFFKLLKKIK